MGATRYIVVEGPIGVGKTTLAKRLAEDLGARAVLEQADENPFLRKFYDHPEKFAFQAQMFFLLGRYQQQKHLAQQDLFSQGTVADYLFCKDKIFAEANLEGDELALYRQMFTLLDSRLPKPDLVVYLQARTDVLLERLRRRDRDYERRIPAAYLRKIAEAYRDFFFYYDETPLLVVDSSDVDFTTRSGDLKDLIREIDQVGHGVQQYIPLGSN